MPFPSVTYTFSNSSTADASQVNQNFTDMINGISDGTKNISVSAGTFAGAVNCQGAVTLGASSSNDLTFNGSVASTVPIKTTTSYDIGSTTIGLRAIYLGDAASAARCTKLLGATIASGWTLTLPTGVPGGAKYILESTTGGVTSFTSRTDLNVVSKTTTYGATRADDVILCSGSAFTVTLPAASDSMKKFVIKKTDSTVTNIITIARAGSDTIVDNTTGLTSTTLNTFMESVTLVSDGSATWYVLERNYPKTFTSFTPTGGWSANTTYTGQWRRDGIFMQIEYKIALAGAPTSANLTLNMPTGYSIDTSRILSSKNGNVLQVGRGGASTAKNMQVVLNPSGPSLLAVYQNATSGALGAVDQSNPSTWGNGDELDFYVEVPITGWN